jgi:hypothetical protein
VLEVGRIERKEPRRTARVKRDQIAAINGGVNISAKCLLRIDCNRRAPPQLK